MKTHIVTVRSHTIILSTQRIIVRGHKLIVWLKLMKDTDILWKYTKITVKVTHNHSWAHKSLWGSQSVTMSHIIIVGTREVIVMVAQSIIAKGLQHQCKDHKQSLSGDHKVIMRAHKSLWRSQNVINIAQIVTTYIITVRAHRFINGAHKLLWMLTKQGEYTKSWESTQCHYDHTESL